jgi:hypothetical protein
VDDERVEVVGQASGGGGVAGRVGRSSGRAVESEVERMERRQRFASKGAN